MSILLAKRQFEQVEGSGLGCESEGCLSPEAGRSLNRTQQTALLCRCWQARAGQGKLSIHNLAHFLCTAYSLTSQLASAFSGNTQLPVMMQILKASTSKS